MPSAGKKGRTWKKRPTTHCPNGHDYALSPVKYRNVTPAGKVYMSRKCVVCTRERMRTEAEKPKPEPVRDMPLNFELPVGNQGASL